MTFAVMTARMSDDVETDAVLAGWQQATLANMRAEAATVERSDFRPAGGLPLVHAQRLLARGRGGDGRAVAAQAVWSARAAPFLPTEAPTRLIATRGFIWLSWVRFRTMNAPPFPRSSLSRPNGSPRISTP